jgi:Rho GTPase-activating protein 1
VFFCAGGADFPPWSWILPHYYKLDQRLRKNLSSLYIIHSNGWSRMIFLAMGFILRFFKTYISPKFSRKLKWCPTLLSLRNYIPLQDLDILDVVHDYDISVCEKVPSTEFGVPLSSMPTISKVVTTCCSFIERYTEQEGLFRISGSKSRIDIAIRKFNLGCQPDLESLGVHGVCGILKQYFRELTETIFPKSLLGTIRSLDQQQLVAEVKSKLISNLDPFVILVFSRLFKTLNLVQLSSSKNRMTVENLAIVWTPNFLKSTEMMLNSSDYSIFQSIVRLLIEQYSTFF